MNTDNTQEEDGFPALGWVAILSGVFGGILVGAGLSIGEQLWKTTGGLAMMVTFVSAVLAISSPATASLVSSKPAN